MKKILFVGVLLFALLIIGCTNTNDDDKIKTPTLTFASTELNVTVGDEFVLTPIITILDGSDLVEYQIDDQTIISFTNGKFNALKDGSTKITASLRAYSDIYIEITVVVEDLREHQITYQLEGGFNPDEVPTKYTLSDIPVTLPIPTRQGFTFGGWDTGTEVISVIESVKGDVVLTAVWNLYEYQITYHLNGGVLSDNVVTSFTTLDLPIVLEVPTKDGYSFLGWYATSDFTGNPVLNIPNNTRNDVEFFAKWVEGSVYDINYNLNGGVLFGSFPRNYYQDILPLELPTPTRVNHAFAGWFDNPDFSGSYITELTDLDEQVLFARWVEQYRYSVTYHTNGGTNAFENRSSFNLHDLPLNLQPASRDGYVFAGWYRNNYFHGDPISEIDFGKDRHLYARWLPALSVTHDVYCNPVLEGTEDGSVVEYNNKEFTYGETAFSSLSDALLVAGGNVYIVGTFTENVTINNSNVHIIGPNANINPHTENRNPEAIIKGEITINTPAASISINGVAFTEGARILGSGAISDFKFKYNYVYDTNQPTQEWRETAGYTEGFLVFNGTDNRLRDLEFLYNKFENVPDASLNFSRVTNISVIGNTFTNFQRDAVRFDHGGLNQGEINFIDNQFINDQVSGYNAIYFRIYGGTDSLLTNITIMNNVFKNIGQEGVLYSGAISMRNFQEKATSINILYNEFENCTNYLHLRNNAAASNHKLNCWNANVNYNIFTGIPVLYYHRSMLGNDNLQTNPTKIDFDFNLYFDDNNQPITDFTPYQDLFLDMQNFQYYTSLSDYQENVLLYDNRRIEIRYQGNGALALGESLSLEATIHSLTDETIEWESSDPSVATVDQSGFVTAVSQGSVLITATINGSIKAAVVGLTVYDEDGLDDLLAYLISINTGVLSTYELYHIGSDDGASDYLNRFYTTASPFHFGDYTIIRNMLPTDRRNYSGQTINVEFITIHDTAGSSVNSTANSISAWCTNISNTGTSWHYTTGNDGMYKHLEDNIRGFHAGDGNRTFSLIDTGVSATTEKPQITVSSMGYYVINGQETHLLAPNLAQINELGIYTTIGDNGNYWINRTYFNNTYKVISNFGGNNNSIGIEMAINDGSDMYFTFQRTAKLSARLMMTHDLGLDRLMYHNNFSGKPCPRSMMTADMVDLFEDLVAAEYHYHKYFSDYSIEFTSHNPNIMDNTGRVISRPLETTNVSFTIKVTNDTTSQEIILNALVPGQITW